jgi:hypothetical protein
MNHSINDEERTGQVSLVLHEAAINDPLMHAFVMTFVGGHFKSYVEMLEAALRYYSDYCQKLIQQNAKLQQMQPIVIKLGDEVMEQRGLG